MRLNKYVMSMTGFARSIALMAFFTLIISSCGYDIDGNMTRREYNRNIRYWQKRYNSREFKREKRFVKTQCRYQIRFIKQTQPIR